MNEDIKTKAAEQPSNSTPEASGGQGEKTFTQDEVNRIVQDRLTREREKLTGQTAKDEREKALEAREARLDCREYLDTKGYPAALLEVLDSADVGKFKAAADKMVELFPGIMPEKQAHKFSGWVPGDGARRASPDSGKDRIAEAFKPKI